MKKVCLYQQEINLHLYFYKAHYDSWFIDFAVVLRPVYIHVAQIL